MVKNLNYYSQHGEDVFLHYLFGSNYKGSYIEVGCIDGIRFSNTYLLEKIGWKGICVEAHPDYIPFLKKRRNAKIEFCAVDNSNKKNVTFYSNRRGSLSTLDPSMENEFKKYGKYFEGWVEKKVETRTLQKIFDKHSITSIDVVSIDIEGTDDRALKSINFKKIMPKVIIVESAIVENSTSVKSILPKSYSLIAHIGCNSIYTCDEKIKNLKIPRYLGVKKLIETNNPLYNEKSFSYYSLIITKTSSTFERYFNELLRRLTKKTVYL